MLLQVTIAVANPQLRSRLETIAAGPNTSVETIKRSRYFWKQIRRKISDVIIISREFIPSLLSDEIKSLQDLPGLPSIVVIADAETSQERAQYVAAGFDVLLESNLAAKVFKTALGAILAKREKLAKQLIPAQRQAPEPLLDSFVAHSKAMKSFIKLARRAARTDSVVLITGETGVGKERLAHTIHNESPRHENPFVAVNCGVFQETLLESELFGHEAGAFTGATQSRRGCFEMAHTGTLFLDEIGEIPTHLQAKLLRVLDDKKIQRLGGEHPLHVDVRILAATNRDLEAEVKARRFRKDLYYRLDVFRITVPPLRERLVDLAELAQSFIDYTSPRIGSAVQRIDDEAIEQLCDYDWPGNVRELFNVLERAMLLCENDTIAAEDLPLHIVTTRVGGEGAGSTGKTTAEAINLPADWLEKPLKDIRRDIYEQAERAYLSHLLRVNHGKVGIVAEQAGINKRALYTKMKRYGFSKEDYR